MADHCIVHIGPSKTGSTSIQHTLYYELDDPAFEYADMGKTNHGKFFHGMFSKALDDTLSRRGRDKSMDEILKIERKSRKLFDKAIRSARAPTLIFSSEGISAFETEEIEKLKAYLDRHFKKITVAAYVRDPIGLMHSTYQERIKAKFVPLEFPQLYRPYRRKFERFDEIFGRDNVHLWRFAPEEFPGGNVVEHFFQALGIAAPGRFRRVNDSLSKPVVQMLYAYHHHAARGDLGDTRQARKRFLMEALSDFDGAKFRFAADVLRPVIDSNGEDIAWMEDRLGSAFVRPPEDGAGAIRDQADMFDIDPAAVAELERRVAEHGGLLPQPADTPLYVAQLMAALSRAIDKGRRHREEE